MKKAILLSVLTLAISQTALARGGGDDNTDGNRLISCTESLTGVKVLEFNSVQGQGQISNGNYDFVVSVRGNDVREMTIKDIKTQNFVRSTRTEEVLTVTLVNGADSLVQTSVQAFTHKGFAQTQVVDIVTGDQAQVQSQNRRSVSRMTVQYAGKAFWNQPISITCQKI